MDKEFFAGYSIGTEEVKVDLLQYVDDTTFIGEAMVENVVMIKSVLRRRRRRIV